MIDSSRTMDRGKWHWAGGFTLVELMVSVTIALFLIGGALTIVARTKNTFAAQNQLAQLQDNERLAMTFMAEVIETGGYFPNPKLYQASNVLPVVAGTFATAGQAVYGTHLTTVPNDDVYVRFGAGLNDNVYGCTGASNTTVGPYDTYTNRFWVKTTGLGVGQASELMCTFTNAAGAVTTVPLVNGVTNMVIFYGVKRNPVDTQSCADSYLKASQMAAADWTNVCSISVTLSFANPLSTTAAPIQINRVIAVMMTAGVNP
jgi:type IV pilus assembly protein PilW